RPGRPGIHLKRRHAHHLAGHHARVGLRPAAVDPHLPRAEQLLQVAEAEPRIARLEPAVEAHSRLAFLDPDLLDACHAHTTQNRLRPSHMPRNSAPIAPATLAAT